MSDTRSLIERARRLLLVSALAPAAAFGVVTVVMYVALRNTQSMLMAVGGAVVLAGIGMWYRWGLRDKPHQWQLVSFSGMVGALFFAMMAAGSGFDEQFELSETENFVVIAAVTVGLALLAWLPARRAARLVLTDLPPEVVDSSLILTFTARGADADTLDVTPDSLRVTVRPTTVLRRSTHTFPLSEVAGVAVRTETDDSKQLVPGSDKSLRVRSGDVVVVDLGEGQLVFAAKDAHQARGFIEARARRWAAVGEE